MASAQAHTFLLLLGTFDTADTTAFLQARGILRSNAIPLSWGSRPSHHRLPVGRLSRINQTLPAPEFLPVHAAVEAVEHILPSRDATQVIFMCRLAQSASPSLSSRHPLHAHVESLRGMCQQLESNAQVRLCVCYLVSPRNHPYSARPLQISSQEVSSALTERASVQAMLIASDPSSWEEDDANNSTQDRSLRKLAYAKIERPSGPVDARVVSVTRLLYLVLMHSRAFRRRWRISMRGAVVTCLPFLQCSCCPLGQQKSGGSRAPLLCSVYVQHRTTRFRAPTWNGWLCLLRSVV